MQPAPSLVVSNVMDTTIVAVQTADLRQEAQLTKIREELVKLVDVLDRKHIIIDMTRVRFAASRFLGILAELAGKSKKIDGWLAMVGLKPELRKPFELIGLHKLYKMFATEEEAMAARPRAL